MKQIVLDFETRSEVDIKSMGAYEYARHPSTEILCAGYKIDDEPASLWTPKDGEPEAILEAIEREAVIVCHNKMFEDCIIQMVLPKYTKKGFGFALPHHRFRCSAAKAAMHGLPRDLERASRVMKLNVVKDMEGNRLVKKYMKPRAAWKKWKAAFDLGEAFDWEEPKKYFDDPDELEKIYDYCLTDVLTEYYLDLKLSHLPEMEQKIWELNQKMNFKGLSVDVETAKLIVRLIEEKSSTLIHQLRELTNGEVETPSQRDRMLKWVKAQGVQIGNLQAGTVSAVLNSLPEGRVKEVLSIRQALGKASVKKFTKLIERGPEGKIRDIAMYHGAHTGRDTGTGFQPHNLPKGNVKDIDEAISDIKSGDLKWIEFLYGDALTLFSSVIRGMITASEGKKLFAADYNAIECRVLNWCAGQLSVLRDFESGADLYVKMANRVGSEDRQLGKTIELAAGFGMGPKKFKETTIAWGVNGGKGVSDEFAEKAIKAYRNSHPLVVKYWKQVEASAILATKKIGRVIRLRHGIEFKREENFLTIRLPSGRKLHYFSPEIRYELTPWGDKLPRIYYWHIDPKTKQWVCGSTYGGKLVENIVQAIARDVMFDGALRTESAGYEYTMSVHDEVVSESASGDIKEFEMLLMKRPKWAPDLPLVVKGWSEFRYRKN